MAESQLDSLSLLGGLTEPALISSGGRIRSATAAARELLGPAIEGAAVSDILSHPAALEALERSGFGLADEVELTGIGGPRRHWLMRVAPMSDESLLVRLVDRSEARAAEQMRVDFVANASHELRTPLSTLIGYTETLREQADEIDAGTRERFLAVVHDEARRMQRVVEDLISLSRIEAEKFTAPTEAVAVRPLLEQAIESVRRAADEHRSRIVLDVAEPLSSIAADQSQILQLLDNLLMNALRYGEPGIAVTLTAHDEGAMVHISVADQGDGIAPQHLARVTERFYRVDTSRSRSLGGTGLGLSIVKHIVERHQGRLTIESEVGQGTNVHVLLPVVGRDKS
jgi:two-component system phosphate regulon sensor histidine kinase PhoR